MSERNNPEAVNVPMEQLPGYISSIAPPNYAVNRDISFMRNFSMERNPQFAATTVGDGSIGMTSNLPTPAGYHAANLASTLVPDNLEGLLGRISEMVNSYCRTYECSTQTVYHELAERYLKGADVPSKQRNLTGWNAYMSLYYNRKKEELEQTGVDDGGKIVAALAEDYRREREASSDVDMLVQGWILRALQSGATGSNASTSVRSVRKSIESVSEGFSGLVLNVPPQHAVRGMAIIYSALPNMSDSFSDAKCPISHPDIQEFFLTIGQTFSPRMILKSLQKYSQAVHTNPGEAAQVKHIIGLIAQTYENPGTSYEYCNKLLDQRLDIVLEHPGKSSLVRQPEASSSRRLGKKRAVESSDVETPTKKLRANNAPTEDEDTPCPPRTRPLAITPFLPPAPTSIGPETPHSNPIDVDALSNEPQVPKATTTTIYGSLNTVGLSETEHQDLAALPFGVLITDDHTVLDPNSNSYWKSATARNSKFDESPLISQMAAGKDSQALRNLLLDVNIGFPIPTDLSMFPTVEGPIAPGTSSHPPMYKGRKGSRKTVVEATFPPANPWTFRALPAGATRQVAKNLIRDVHSAFVPGGVKNLPTFLQTHGLDVLNLPGQVTPWYNLEKLDIKFADTHTLYFMVDSILSVDPRGAMRCVSRHHWDEARLNRPGFFNYSNCGGTLQYYHGYSINTNGTDHVIHREPADCPCQLSTCRPFSKENFARLLHSLLNFATPLLVVIAFEDAERFLEEEQKNPGTHRGLHDLAFIKCFLAIKKRNNEIGIQPNQCPGYRVCWEESSNPSLQQQEIGNPAPAHHPETRVNETRTNETRTNETRTNEELQTPSTSRLQVPLHNPRTPPPQPVNQASLLATPIRVSLRVTAPTPTTARVLAPQSDLLAQPAPPSNLLAPPAANVDNLGRSPSPTGTLSAGPGWKNGLMKASTLYTRRAKKTNIYLVVADYAARILAPNDDFTKLLEDGFSIPEAFESEDGGPALFENPVTFIFVASVIQSAALQGRDPASATDTTIALTLSQVTSLISLFPAKDYRMGDITAFSSPTKRDLELAAKGQLPDVETTYVNTFFQWSLAHLTGLLDNIKWSLASYVLAEDPDWFSTRPFALGPTDEMVLRFFEVVKLTRQTSMLIRWEILGAVLSKIWIHTSLSDRTPIQSPNLAINLESESLFGFVTTPVLSYVGLHWRDMDGAPSTMNPESDLSMEALLLEAMWFHLSVESIRHDAHLSPTPDMLIQDADEFPTTLHLRVFFMMRYALDLNQLIFECEVQPAKTLDALNANPTTLKRIGDQGRLWELVLLAREQLRSREYLVMATNMFEGGFAAFKAFSTYTSSTLLDNHPLKEKAKDNVDFYAKAGERLTDQMGKFANLTTQFNYEDFYFT